MGMLFFSFFYVFNLYGMTVGPIMHGRICKIASHMQGLCAIICSWYLGGKHKYGKTSTWFHYYPYSQNNSLVLDLLLSILLQGCVHLKQYLDEFHHPAASRLLGLSQQLNLLSWLLMLLSVYTKSRMWVSGVPY
jgi:hypothetical protein